MCAFATIFGLWSSARCIYDLVALGTTENWQGDGWFGVRSGGIFFPMCAASEIEGL